MRYYISTRYEQKHLVYRWNSNQFEYKSSRDLTGKWTLSVDFAGASIDDLPQGLQERTLQEIADHFSSVPNLLAHLCE